MRKKIYDKNNDNKAKSNKINKAVVPCLICGLMVASTSAVVLADSQAQGVSSTTTTSLETGASSSASAVASDPKQGDSLMSPASTSPKAETTFTRHLNVLTMTNVEDGSSFFITPSKGITIPNIEVTLKDGKLQIGGADYTYSIGIYGNSFTLDYDKKSKTVKMTVNVDSDYEKFYLGTVASTYHNTQPSKGLWVDVAEMKKELEKQQSGSTAPNGGDGNQVPPVTGDSSPQDGNAHTSPQEESLRDITDLYKTTQGDNLIILFGSTPFRIHLKDGNQDKKLERAVMKIGSKNPKYKPLNGINNDAGLFFGIKTLSKEKDGKHYFTFSSDNVDEKNLTGRFSGELELKFVGEGKRRNKGKLSFIRLIKPANPEKETKYVGEDANEFLSKLLSGTKLIYGDVPPLPSEEEMSKMKPWKKNSLKNVHAERIADKAYLEQLFEEKKEGSQEYKYKKISEVLKDGEKVEAENIFKEVGTYTIKIQFTNPTYVLNEQNKPQTLTLEQHVTVTDVKKPIKEEIEELTTGKLEELKEKLPESKKENFKTLGVYKTFANSYQAIRTNKEKAIKMLEQASNKDLDPDVNEQTALKTKKDILNKLIADNDSILAIANAIENANALLEKIQNSALTDEQKEKFVKEIKIQEHLKEFESDSSELKELNELQALNQKYESALEKVQDEVYRLSAIQEVKNAMAEKTATLRADSSLIDEEKAPLFEKITGSFVNARTNIMNATSTTDVDAQKNEAIKTINEIEHKGVKKKETAIQEVKNAMAEKTATLRADSSLIDEEKAPLFEKITGSFVNARTNIMNATSTTDVDAQKNEAIKTINEIEHKGVKKKETAIQEVKNAMAEKTATLRADSSLIDEEKAPLFEKITGSFVNARTNIMNATSTTDVDAQKNEAIKTINKIEHKGVKKKETAKEALEKVYNAKKEEITSSKQSAEGKAHSDRKLQEVYDKALEELSKAETLSLLNDKKETGENQLRAVEIISDQKGEALTEPKKPEYDINDEDTLKKGLPTQKGEALTEPKKPEYDINDEDTLKKGLPTQKGEALTEPKKPEYDINDEDTLKKGLPTQKGEALTEPKKPEYDINDEDTLKKGLPTQKGEALTEPKKPEYDINDEDTLKKGLPTQKGEGLTEPEKPKYDINGRKILKDKLPQTGERSNVGQYTFAMLLSAMAFVVTLFRRKKRKIKVR